MDKRIDADGAAPRPKGDFTRLVMLLEGLPTVIAAGLYEAYQVGKAGQ